VDSGEVKMSTKGKAATWVILLAVLLVVAVFRIEKNHSGEYGNVRVATPFGGVEIKTNDTSVVQGVGLPAYPEAELQRKEGDYNGDADVDMKFGGVRLRVTTVRYKSSDSPDKVSAFYRKALSRYGDVIECHNGLSVGIPTQTPEGLTCDKADAHLSSDGSDMMELKAGSKQFRHIVVIDPDRNGSMMELVAVQMPKHIPWGSRAEDVAHEQ
jgi:hypothetical protein